jgi:hypothetical protein
MELFHFKLMILHVTLVNKYINVKKTKLLWLKATGILYKHSHIFFYRFLLVYYMVNIIKNIFTVY